MLNIVHDTEHGRATSTFACVNSRERRERWPSGKMQRNHESERARERARKRERERERERERAAGGKR